MVSVSRVQFLEVSGYLQTTATESLDKITKIEALERIYLFTTTFTLKLPYHTYLLKLKAIKL